MGKGRKKILSKDDIADIVDALQTDKSLTKREIAYNYQISLYTLYKALPAYLKTYKNFPKFNKDHPKNEGDE